MNMMEWAKREVEIAKNRERGDKPSTGWNYGCACYDSALKAFESLCEDGHSGMSVWFTKNVLNRLIEGKPLTPIEDTDDNWSLAPELNGNNVDTFHCIRMSSLFKDVDSNGNVSYQDVDRFLMVDTISNITWHSGLTDRIGAELYPVTMPYMPEEKPYKIYCEEISTDPKNGDYDTEAVFYIVTPSGEKKEINRYFREPNDGEEPTYYGWVEIDFPEYFQRKCIMRG